MRWEVEETVVATRVAGGGYQAHCGGGLMVGAAHSDTLGKSSRRDRYRMWEEVRDTDNVRVGGGTQVNYGLVGGLWLNGGKRRGLVLIRF